MRGRERLSIDQLGSHVWGKDADEITDNAIDIAVSRANGFLGERKEKKCLRKQEDGSIVWVE
jgi:hypothetical protein